MKSMILNIQDGGISYSALSFVCPGCELGSARATGLHVLPVNSIFKSPSWVWDGNLETPTISPSIKTEWGSEGDRHVCHSFLNAGVFEFLSDSTHALSGQHVPMLDLPEWFIKERTIDGQ